MFHVCYVYQTTYSTDNCINVFQSNHSLQFHITDQTNTIVINNQSIRNGKTALGQLLQLYKGAVFTIISGAVFNAGPFSLVTLLTGGAFDLDPYPI